MPWSTAGASALAIVDDLTRECLALVADTSLSGARVVRELDVLAAARSKPAMIVSDNGSELTSLAVLRWQQDIGVAWHYIQPGKPIQARIWCRDRCSAGHCLGICRANAWCMLRRRRARQR